MKASVNGTILDYALSGPAGAPTVVLGHSLATSRAMWAPQIESLVWRYRVLEFDMRGHGASAAPDGPYSLDMLADDAAGLIEYLGLGRVRYVGLSIGGMIGQALALRHPGLLEGLVLASTTSRIPQDAQAVWDERIAAVRAGGIATQTAATLERWFTPLCREQRPALIARVGGMIGATPAAGYIGCCHAIKGLDLTDRLGEIRVPTLVMVGRQDMGTPVAVAETIQRGIPGARLTVIEQASHQAGLEQPEAFNAALLDFLDSLDS
ncbi:MAG: 3-oxoadipate enol-lactonase [Magnetospirillum sp. WYHS-4]